MIKKITMGKTTRRKLAIDESRMLIVTRNNRLVSISSEYVNNVIQYFKVRDGEIKYLRNTTGLEREKFRRDCNQRATNKYLYSTTNYNLGHHNNDHGRLQSSIFTKK